MSQKLTRSFIAFSLAATSLTGCFSMTAKTTPVLEGERLNITFQPSGLTANPAAQAEELVLPEAVVNPYWGQVGGVPSHAAGQLALPAKVVRAWSSSIGTGASRGAALLNPPVVHAGRVFGLDTQGHITALDIQNGKQLWRATLEVKEEELAKLSGGIAVTGDLLFATTGSGQIFCLQASTGKQVWEIDLGVPLRAAPTVDGDRVFVTSHDSRVFALSALDGKLQWTHSGLEETLGSLRAAPSASANGVVAVPYSSGELYILRATDGRYLWHDALSTAFTGQDPAATLTSIASPPVIADGIVYAGGLGGGLSAYGLAGGQRFWKTDITTSQPFVVASSALFVLTDKGELAALNRRDGLIRWVTNVAKDLPANNRNWSGPIFAGGRLIVASTDGYAVSINPTTGERLAATELGEPVSLSPIVADNMLFFLTDKGRIIAFKGQ